MSRTTSTNNVRPIAPEVKRDAYGSYLPGDRSPAMARAIAADIRRRALTEPGYLDHYKADAASELPTVAQSTSRHAPFINLEVGTLVRYRYGGEAWAFSAQTTRDKHWKVQSIHINQASNGVAHSVWLRLEGRQVPISLGEVTVVPTSAQREGQTSLEGV